MKIGVLGGGQLGQMLGEAGASLGHTFTFLDPNPQSCAASAGDLIVGAFDDESALRTLAEQCDVVTYEFENVPTESVAFLQELVTVHPSPVVLQETQDRFTEKTVCNAQGIPTAAFANADSEETLTAAIEEIGYPCILKTRRMGYDGKGQVFMRSAEDLDSAKELVVAQACILEQCIAFEREVSIIATRSTSGEIVYYPLSENVHREGILHSSQSPATAEAHTQEQAENIAKTLLEHFNYVGTMAVELFVQSDGSVLLNEIAPRVHNSGHWTIEGIETSQFENHIRAICNMPLGSTAPCGHSAMVNVIGIHPATDELEQMEGVTVHFYGKEERAKRKIGHITICHDDLQHVAEHFGKVETIVEAVHME